MDQPTQVERDRQLIVDAQGKGLGSTVSAYVRLSGPGWLQSAITLGGGSLAGALFLGSLGGTSMLWLQLVAIAMGVIMLSAISYITLSTGRRPFQAINEDINPVLGWGWLIATILANMIWCMPQFSLCFAALQKNLVGPETITDGHKTIVSVALLIAASIAVVLNSREGAAAKVFDWFLKALVGIVVVCFVGVVALLSFKGALDWGAILAGFIPRPSQYFEPTGEVGKLVASLPESVQAYWHTTVVGEQRNRMIASAATAVGINMTFLMPYTLLKRGWDKPFRGLARFDLSTGMAIPYILVTSCVIIAAASKFHAEADEAFLSTDPAVMQTSSIYKGAEKILKARVAKDSVSADDEAAAIANLTVAEKKIAASLVQRSAFDLSKALVPLLDEKTAQIAFGLGILGMGFSTIIILMLINGFAFCEMLGKPLGGPVHVIGCLVAGISGAMWPMFWDGQSKLYLAIVTSTFGIMLLPIAYITFMMMMNSKKLMGDEKPTGGRLLGWNLLMGISVLGALVAAGFAMYGKIGDPKAGPIVIGMAVVYVIAVIIGFVKKSASAR